MGGPQLRKKKNKQQADRQNTKEHIVIWICSCAIHELRSENNILGSIGIPESKKHEFGINWNSRI